MTEYQEKLVELKDQGLSVSEIAPLVNRSVRTVSRNLKDLGLTKNGRSDILDSDVLKMWNDGYTIVEIAGHFKASHETISKRLAKMGIVCNRSDGIRRHFERVRGDMVERDYSVKRVDGSNDIDRSGMRAGFIDKAIRVHGNIYDYSQVEYLNSKTKVSIICPMHGAFEQTPDKHLRGEGCPLCGDDKLRATNQARYGVDRPLQNREICDRSVETCLAVYDAANPLGAESVKEKRKQTVRERFGVDYACQAESVLRARIETNIRKYGGMSPFCSELVRDKADGSKLARYGTTNTMALDSVKRKVRDTKARNHTFHVSRPENLMYERLCDIFGEVDVIWQFESEEYPFACDFYIKSRNLYIELNVSWTHGGHWFDGSSCDDAARLELWQTKGMVSEYYRNAVHTWTDLDVRKRAVATANGLNYAVFWRNNLFDFFEWLSAGCPDRRDWE